jgi:hypothetical protein
MGRLKFDSSFLLPQDTPFLLGTMHAQQGLKHEMESIVKCAVADGRKCEFVYNDIFAHRVVDCIPIDVLVLI